MQTSPPQFLPTEEIRRSWAVELKVPTLFNTLTREVEFFEPLQSPHIGMYTCGPTVYGAAHIGNMRAYIFADTLRRVMELHGFQVKHVMNLTDVGHLASDADEGEDKMEIGKKREGLSAWDIAEKYSTLFFEHTRALNILPPTIVCKATDHIREQIELIQQLEAKGYTYTTSDGVYFNSARFERYGELAKLNIENNLAGHRVSIGEKKSPSDFALWKFAPEGVIREMEWPSPWGRGFPGWHIECSAMAMKFLGSTIDIHTGGIDHIPVHHTNEIAQSECATGHSPFVRYWVHGEFLVLSGDLRMGKSQGNSVTVQTLIDRGYDPLAYRYFCLSASYRKSLRFNWEALDGAATGYERLKLSVGKVLRETGKDFKPSRELNSSVGKLILSTCGADLDTSRTLGLLWETLNEQNKPVEVKRTVILWADVILGLKLHEESVSEITRSAAEQATIPEELRGLLAARKLYREQRNFAEADRIRKSILDLGYDVVDSSSGSQLIKK